MKCNFTLWTILIWYLCCLQVKILCSTSIWKYSGHWHIDKSFYMLYDVHYEYVYFKFQAIGLVAIISTRIVQWNGTATPLKSWHLWIWKVVNQTSLHHSVVYHHGHRIPFLGEVTSVVLNYLSFVNFRQEVNEICILC